MGDYIEFGKGKQQYNTLSSVGLKLQLDYCFNIVFLMKILLSHIHLVFFDL